MKQKIKIMNPKPDLPDDEIRSYMDFDGLLIKQKAQSVSQKMWWLKWSAGVVLLAGVSYWFLINKQNEIPKAEEHTVVHQPLQEEQHVKPEPDAVEVPKQEEPKAAQQITEAKEKRSKQITKEQSRPDVAIAADDAKKTKPIEVEATESVYVQAEPVNGYADLYDYFARNLVYPQESLKDSVQGVVTVVFLINTQGKPDKVEIKQSLGENFDLEAKRLIENMPEWKPALLNGKPVESKISLPITFQIAKVKAKD